MVWMFKKPANSKTRALLGLIVNLTRESKLLMMLVKRHSSPKRQVQSEFSASAAATNPKTLTQVLLWISRIELDRVFTSEKLTLSIRANGNELVRANSQDTKIIGPRCCEWIRGDRQISWRLFIHCVRQNAKRGFPFFDEHHSGQRHSFLSCELFFIRRRFLLTRGELDSTFLYHREKKGKIFPQRFLLW